MICEDYLSTSILSEIQTGKMQATSIDYSFSSDQQALITFSSGHLLLMSPMLRARGDLIWLNTKKNNYSSRPPSVCRWLNEYEFLVVFGDTLLWRFDKRLSGEDEKFIQAAQNNTRDSTLPIASIPHLHAEANPTALHKLQIGRIRDMQVGQGTKRHLLCIVTELELKIMDLVNSSIAHSLRGYFSGFQCVCWSEDGVLLVAGGEDDCVHVWNTSTWEVICRGVSHDSWVSGVFCEVDQGGYNVCSVGFDGILCVWELPKVEPRQEKVNAAEYSEYPCRQKQNIIEANSKVVISEEPLIAVYNHSGSYFICDMGGVVHRWVYQ